MSKPTLPELRSDEEAAAFVDEADLSAYDLSNAKPHRFNIAAEPYAFEIFQDANGEFRARFRRGGEVFLTTEAYPSETSAKRAIDTIRQNGSAAIVKSDSARDAA